MRLFFGITIEERLIENFHSVLDLKGQLENLNYRSRWVPPQNFHISLSFLGEVEEEKLPLLKDILSKSIEEIQKFELNLSGLGAFPSSRSARVLWMGVEENEALRTLQKRLTEMLVASGFKLEERHYRPHLTLARFKFPSPLRRLLPPHQNQRFGSMVIEKVSLFQSKLSDKDPLYKTVFEVPLPDR